MSDVGYLRGVLEGLEGERVTLFTTGQTTRPNAGAVTGRVETVGTDYVQVVKDSGATVYVALVHLVRVTVVPENG